MSRTIIKVNNLGKSYRIGEIIRHDTLRDAASHLFSRAFRRSPSRKHDSDVIWALDSVNFEVQQGEVVGIIGRNGAGKSTLLKILSRITMPTQGQATIEGRVGSLLEVGTGFHPELTGRENVYLNGAILGMKKLEIKNKFDEIVDFSGVDKFIDTPIKRYSSGMYLRLAFAVAAHLEPEILLVDEVLAVGDIDFQRKCLNKMKVIGQGGRTVLFVSHNMPAVTRLCSRVILFDKGRKAEDGSPHAVVGAYLKSDIGTSAQREWKMPAKAPGNEVVRLNAVRVCTEDGRTTESIDIRKPVCIEMEYDVLESNQVLVPNYHIFNDEGICVFITTDCSNDWSRKPRPKGHYLSRVRIPGNFLSEGCLIVNVAICTMIPVRIHFHEADAVAFHVVDSLDGNSARGDYGGDYPGVVRPLLEWTTQYNKAFD